MMNTLYVYFISFSHGLNELGFGNTEVFLKKKIDSINDINDIAHCLQDNNNLKNVVVLNYSFLRETKER